MKKGPGRPKGSVNKVTGNIRAMVEGALAAAGGLKYLTQQAKDNPGPFLALVGKCLPKDVVLSGSVGNYSAIPIPVDEREPIPDHTPLAESARTAERSH